MVYTKIHKTNLLLVLQFVGVESFCTSLIDTWPKVIRRGHRKEILIGITCLVMFLIGLIMVTEVPVR